MSNKKYFEGDASFLGEKFGRLSVISGVVRIKKEAWVKVLCDCKVEKMVRITELNNGKTSSCGCARLEANTIHGYSKSRVYKIWKGIVKRCCNSNASGYYNYGERGIKVCDRWLNFENFLEDMGEPKEGESIDRINNNGNYEQSNCRWATKTTQMRNFRRNKLVEYNGEVHCLSEWEEILEINRGVLGYRLSHGWPIDKAFTAPIRKMRSNKII